MRKPSKLTAAQLWEYALRQLGQKAQSAAEIRAKLLRRAELPSDVPETMAKLREYGLTDDRKFSESFAASRLQNQGFGRHRVIRDLRAKRVANPVAAQAIERAYEGTEESALIEAYIARKYRGKDLREFLKEEKNAASLFRRLRTAGFSTSGTLAAIKRYSSAVDEWGEPPDNEDESGPV